MTAESPQAPLTNDATRQRLVESLKGRNVETFVAEGGEAARELLVELVPPGAELYKGTSETLDAIGYTRYLQQTDRYRYLNPEISAEPDPAKQRELRRLSSVAEYYVGSVHAVAQSGEVVVASGSGSQLAAYVYGAKHVIWVVGAQKVCPTLEDALARVRGYALERRDQWLEEHGRAASPLGKLMVFEHEQTPGRVQMIVIKQSVGW
jgi:hypothetical protein